MSNYTRKRLDAVKTCEERGWGLGTVLCSGKWVVPRVIREIAPNQVRLGLLKRRGEAVDCRSLPADVAEVA